MTEPEGPVPFRTFILKVANRCNIDCDYCFVFNSKDQAARRLPARMDLAVVRAAARRIGEHASAHRLGAIHVVLHGGEPLLVGVGHMAGLLQAVRDSVPAGTRVLFELQTNGTLLSDAWLDLFERYEVAVGVSLDGPPRANDRHRLTHAGRSSAGSAVRGIELLRSRPHLFAGLLAVVDLANDPVEVHDYLAAFEPPVIDFGLPHATHDDPPHRSDPSVPEYGLWMSRVYDAWLARPEYGHSVRMLEDIVALSSGVRGSVETLGLAPPTSVVIESDGSIEAVDTLRSVEEGASWLGLDVLRHSFDEALSHPKLLHRQHGMDALAEQCRACPLVDVCGGGYLPHRFSEAQSYRNPSVYCADLEYLIRHVQGSLRQHGWNPYARAASSP
ncbi:FxsB family cyclophane-forming radical SAM/SPASM peptide maturase [Streptomyces ipomoeae]|uniref:FxsB family cyclophane-forming radical SAM/SPASM peptide maturase n=1 Tax=Streptomyces ipomoeae TaxID=103232 RepID=UPI001147953A|nr:FxsB family cyclophane-forming radical SAM/SPASM peptide maturase [Streptomyces ipomoeae]MDX2936393.1 FxsB family radical SAM/SPASM domain protein [Streptomyces ipomoeae]TQE24487.1 FxsB family radical SAM/SPASM domain protein [Streptomyces ipomoeae]